MYRIILTNWYQELKGDGTQLEILPQKFESIGNAINYLYVKQDKILDNFPVESIELKFLK